MLNLVMVENGCILTSDLYFFADLWLDLCKFTNYVGVPLYLALPGKITAFEAMPFFVIVCVS
jgi:hypothetical protein